MKQSYNALFWLCLSYIAVFSLASLTNLWYLSSLFELAALALAWVVSRRTLVCQAAPADYSLGFSPKPLLPTLPLLPFFVGGVVGLSLLMTFLGEKLGLPVSFDYGDDPWVCLLTSAILPAVTEEIFCRYLFLRYLTPHSQGGAILASAVFFAFLHGNFYQMPYALFAGVFLGTMAVVTGSVLPGVLFHLVNNIASILLAFCEDTPVPRVLFWVLIAGLLCGAVYVVLVRKRLFDRLRAVFSSGGNLRVLGGLFLSPLVIFLILFLGEAVLRLWQN